MNALLEKYNDFKLINNYIIEFNIENGIIIEFKLRQLDFPHLIGLHKLKDIPIIRQFNDSSNKIVNSKYILSQIKKEDKLTYDIISNSKYFPLIKDRYDSFSKEQLLNLSYTDVIVDFDATVINSKLNAQYILFEQTKNQGYNHLCIATTPQKTNYTESFFYEPTDLYIKNQNTLKIEGVKIYDEKGLLYMEDDFTEKGIVDENIQEND